MMKTASLCLVGMLVFMACRQDRSQAVPTVPPEPVTADESHINQAYIDSLDTNRKQRLIDLRRELGFECVHLAGDQHVNVKIKVYPDGSHDEVEVLEQEGLDTDSIRACVKSYFEKNSQLNFGRLMDLPGSGKTTNQHPHVYTLLIY